MRPGVSYHQNDEGNILSYDLTVYCPGSPSVDQVRLLVGNTRGLHADPTVSEDDGVVVLRGVKRGYSFTVDGPFSVEAEDVPEEITEVLPDVAMMFRILLEGTQETEIPHGVRFARKLAKACHGVVLDEQTSEVWPPRTVRVEPQGRKPRSNDEVWLHWLLLEDDLPADFLKRYIRLAQELLPQAVPERFGKYEPLYMTLESDGVEGFVNEYYRNDANAWDIFYKNPSPVRYGSISGPELARGRPFTRITMRVDRPALKDETLRASLRQFFVAVASELGAVYASAEVLKDSDIVRSPYLYMPPWQWVGFPPYPLWWVWVGPRLRPEIGRFLGSNASEHSDGVFRVFSDEPLDRRELSELLGPENLPWIPAEYSGTYADGEEMQVDPLTTATAIPAVLLPRAPLSLPFGVVNPPRVVG